MGPLGHRTSPKVWEVQYAFPVYPLSDITIEICVQREVGFVSGGTPGDDGGAVSAVLTLLSDSGVWSHRRAI